MTENAPTAGQLKDLGIHVLKGIPADPAGLAGTMWDEHLNNAKSHEALMLMLGMSPAEAVLRLMTKPNVPFPIWRSVKIGTRKSPATLRNAVRKAANVSVWADRLMVKMTVATKHCEINLYRATVAELGFPNGAEFAEIRSKIHKLGFCDCPAEVGPQLRLQYKDQPKGEWARIMMDPIADSSGVPGVFDVKQRGRHLWLYVGDASPGNIYDGDRILVFAR